ncbi:1,5-anhydro-D-fructose reductase [Papilio machaon]|uniref:1,5-anhydro-D-fructose reductase n=1 Tax=Papilio machaon TaxID=76193 RepID=A0A0N1PGI8_PAPMA|nr:1,5-anhydro-D-fructose reductase [Papilio machaon]
MSEKNIESNVPGEHNIREVNDEELKEKESLINEDKAQTSTSFIDKQNESLTEGNTSEIATADDFTLSPVITVTKKEATFTKGDLKLQKVTVTEDISHTSTSNVGEEKFNRRLTYEIHTSGKQPKNTNDGAKEEKTADPDRLKTKIPISRLRQAVNKVKNDLKEKKRLEKEKDIASSSRKSSIPRLKDSKTPPPRDTYIKRKEEILTAKADEEFDRIFQELNPTEDTSLEFINTDIENVNQIENSFEEIIHAYEENKITQANDTGKIKQSRIPLLKRKSEHEIEVTKIKEKQSLIKSNSVDTKIQTSFNQDITEKRIASEQTKTYTHSNVTTEIYTVQKESNEVMNNTTNTVVFQNQTSLPKTDTQNQINSNEIKETIKVAIPNFDIQTSEGIKSNESIEKTTIDNETEDLTQDITITKNLNFDKETVSMIYKIDFTENNFDSLDMTQLNESMKRDQIDVKNDNNESNNVNITKEISHTESMSKSKQTESSSKSTKTIERTNYDENIELDIQSVSEIKANQTTDNNSLSKVTLAQSSETKENIKTNSESIKQVSLETNKTTETKTTNVSSKTSTFYVEETNSNHIIGETSKQSIKTNKSSEIKQELFLDNKKNEFGTNQSIAREVSLEGSKIINHLTSESSVTLRTGEESESTKPELLQNSDIQSESVKTSVRQVTLEGHTVALKTDVIKSGAIYMKSERNDKEKLGKLDKTENFEYDNVSSSKNKSIILDTEKLSIESSIQSLKTNESSNEKQNKNDKTSFETENLHANEEISIENLKNKRNKSTKLEELSRRYENIEFDVNSKKTSVETNKSIENKTTTYNSNEKSTDTNENIQTLEKIGHTKDQSLNKDDINDSTKSVLVSANENKAKGTVTTTLNNTQHSTISSSKYLNSESNKLTVASTKMTASNTSLNNTDTSINTRDVTKSLTNLNTQNTEDINKIYSEVLTKMNAQNKQSFGITKEINNVNSKHDKHENNIPDIDTALEEEIPILRGKVNRVIRRISSIDNMKPVDKSSNDLPKKKSVLSKIQMFERGEIDETYPKTRIPKLDSKTSRIPNTLRQTSTELRRPKIVKEIFKETNESKREITENTSKQNQVEKTAHNEFIKDESYISGDTKLNDDRSSKYTETDAKLLRTNYKQVKDVIKEINNKVTEDNSTRNKNNTVEETSDISTLSVQKSFDTKTEISINDNENKSQIQNEDFEIINKDESSKYTKIYTNNKSDKSLNINKYGSINTNIEDLTIKKFNKTNEDVFNFTPKENNSNNISNISNDITTSRHIDVTNEDSNYVPNEVKKELNTNKYINNENFIYTENKAKSLEYIRHNSTRKSYERLQSDYKDGRRDFDMRRTTSVAELEIGEVVKGRVLTEMIMRINSMEIISQGKKEIHREQPRKSSVSEKIALFEGKLPPIKTEKRKETYRMKNEKEVNVEMTEEEYTKKILQLKNVKNNYKNVDPEYLELRDCSEMPVIALGTALLDKRLIRYVVEAAIDMGYRAIDTAYIYGNEKEIGEAINNKINDGTVKREDLYIISKLWSTYHRKDLVEKACRQSLDNMGLKYFDLYLIHNPMSLLEGSDPLPKIANVLQYSEHDYMDAWRGIEDLIIKGLVRRGGVSNFNSEQVHRVMEKGRIKPVVNQVECHPYLSQERLGGFCDAYGMRLSCYGVLGSKGTPAEHKSDLPPVIDDPLVLVMAAGLGVTPGQMLIAYQLHNNRSVVIKATSAARLYENLKAQFISLEPSHLTALKSLNKNKRTYYLKGLGETHKNYPFNIAF